MTFPFVADLSSCQSTRQLAVALGIDHDVLCQLGSVQAVSHYRAHTIPKHSRHRKGETRDVFEPESPELRQVHKTLNRRLLAYAQHRDPAFPPPCCFGFVRGRSTLDNARLHLGQRLLLRVDIEDYFPTISRARVCHMFVGLGLHADCAGLLSRILCFPGFLAPGLSSSPVVSNLVARPLDRRLMDLAARNHARFSRYADDIAFSGDSIPSVSDVSRTLEAEGFRISPRKVRVTKLGQAHFVTGLSIQDPQRPHVPKRMKRRLRQELYYCNKIGIAEHLTRLNAQVGEGLNRLDGTVRYVSFVERGTSSDLSREWDRLLARDDLIPRINANYDGEDEPWFAVVDETIIEHRGRTWLALGLVIYTDARTIEKKLSSVLSNYLANPFAPGKKATIRKNGLHYVDAHAELKAKVVEQLPTLPMRTLVGIIDLSEVNASEIQVAYLRLLAWGLAMVYQRMDGRRFTLFVEKCTAVKRTAVEDVVSKTYYLREDAGVARPVEAPKVELVDKSFACVALPDFMLGILRSYIEKEDSGDTGSLELLHFEAVRDRFTLIHYLPDGVYFSRHNPFHRGCLG